MLILYSFLQDGILFANVLVFLGRDQLRQVGEDMENVQPCVVEHCFAFCMQDISLAEVDVVRPYLPSRIFVKDNTRWRAASEVFRTNNILRIINFVSASGRLTTMLLNFSIHIQAERVQFLSPHPVKDVAEGRPVRVCPVVLYSDDTSGNRSKKWNCFNVWCVQFAALPRHENSKLQNIFYICCSNAVKSECILFINVLRCACATV